MEANAEYLDRDNKINYHERTEKQSFRTWCPPCFINRVKNVYLEENTNIAANSYISAGAVVNKDIPPYCIAGGVPAKVIKRIWTIDEILQHEAAFYPVEERYTREQLEEIYSDYIFK